MLMIQSGWQCALSVMIYSGDNIDPYEFFKLLRIYREYGHLGDLQVLPVTIILVSVRF